MKTATWTIAPERLRPGYKAFRLLDNAGNGIARLSVDPNNARRPYRLSMWPVGKVCLSTNDLTQEQVVAVLAHVFHNYKPEGLDLSSLPE